MGFEQKLPRVRMPVSDDDRPKAVTGADVLAKFALAATDRIQRLEIEIGALVAKVDAVGQKIAVIEATLTRLEAQEAAVNVLVASNHDLQRAAAREAERRNVHMQLGEMFEAICAEFGLSPEVAKGHHRSFAAKRLRLAFHARAKALRYMTVDIAAVLQISPNALRVMVARAERGAR